LTDEKIKLIVKRYRNIATLWLFAFLFFAMTANWFLISKNIDHHIELGLDYVPGEQGYTWGAILSGLYILLLLVFYSIEKILIAMNQQN
jgi:hypothetical protein